MLLVKTIVKPSVIAGLGLFAEEDIRQGEMIWRYDPDTSLILTQGQFDILRKSCNHVENLLHYLTYGWFIEKLDGVAVCLDNARFFNHSPQSNSGQFLFSDDAWKYSYALRDISKGEELTEDYRSYDSSAWYEDLHKSYNIFSIANIA